MQPAFHVGPQVVDLARAFDIHSIHSEAELPRMKVRTWFLDHVRFRLNPLIRHVQVTPPWDQWHQLLIQTWADILDFSATVQYCVVKPVPLQGDSRETWVDIIVWQRFTVARRAALAKIRMKDGSRTLAVSIPCPATKHSLLRALWPHVDTTDALNPATLVYHGEHAIGPTLQFTPDDGFGYTIIMPEEATEAPDAVSLMQHALQDDGSTLPSQSVWSSNVAIEPMLHPLEQLLKNKFHGNVPEDQKPRSPVFRVRTFFLSAEREPVQRKFRDVILDTPPHMWTSNIVQAWKERIIADREYYWFLCEPHIMLADPSENIDAWVIIAQDPAPGFSFVLLSASTPDDQATYLARVVPDRLIAKQAFLLADCGPVCLMPTSAIRCIAKAASTYLTHEPLAIPSGVHVRVHMFRIPHQCPSHPADHASFMQFTPHAVGDEWEVASRAWHAFTQELQEDCSSVVDLRTWFIDHVSHMRNIAKR